MVATKVEHLGPWYTLEAGAGLLGLTRQTVYEGLRRYEIPVLELGGTLLFRPDEYEWARREYMG